MTPMRPLLTTRVVPAVRRRLALALALTMLCPTTGPWLAAAQAQGTAQPSLASASDAALGIRSIMLFPFVNGVSSGAADTGTPAPAQTGTPAGGDIGAVAAKLDDAVKFRINTIGAFRATSFNRFLPAIQRGTQTDNTLTTDDITPPFDADHGGAAKAGKVAALVGTDGYLIGRIESFSVDQTSRKVTLEASAYVYNTASGALLRTYAFTGTAAPVTNSESNDIVTQRAVNDVASKIVAALNAGAQRQQTGPVLTRHSSGSSGAAVLLVILGGALLAAALQHHGSSSSPASSSSGSPSTNPGGPPSPPTLP